ncbi:substrate-binding periplasmic protein [Aliiglaciecola litoralis]|uniref:ABC transporter substrate-binding protein n=1 Tax=Aliiglaciecola litoralis TaxID=582857 RepID=A0ABN1LRL9_9ALTE
MLKSSLLFRAAVWLYLVTVSTYTHAQDAEDFWILTNPEPPFVMVNDKRQMDGYLIDVIYGITHVAGINQRILAAPWQRVELEARSKSNVLAFALARTPEREDRYHWITPLTANVYSVFSAIGEKDQFSGLSQLSALPSIAVLENDARHKILIQAKYPAIHAFATWSQAIESVTSGKSAAIFFSDPGMSYFCTTLGKDCNALKRVFMYRKIVSYLTMSKVESNPVLVDTLTKAAEEFKQSSQFNDTVAKWLDIYQSQPIAMHMDNGVMNLWQQ